jgi:hypothetical protein
VKVQSWAWAGRAEDAKELESIVQGFKNSLSMLAPHVRSMPSFVADSYSEPFDPSAGFDFLNQLDQPFLPGFADDFLSPASSGSSAGGADPLFQGDFYSLPDVSSSTEGIPDVNTIAMFDLLHPMST